jgi:hypothetical protein
MRTSGRASSSKLDHSYGPTVDVKGDVDVTTGSRIYEGDPRGTITTIAGTCEGGVSGDGGPATKPKVAAPRGLAADGKGNLYLADTFSYRVRKVRRRLSAVSSVLRTPGGGRSALDSPSNALRSDARAGSSSAPLRRREPVPPRSRLVSGRAMRSRTLTVQTLRNAYGSPVRLSHPVMMSPNLTTRRRLSALGLVGVLDPAPMTSGRQWRLKHYPRL